MNVLILAAGTGSRLAPYTDNTPKALVKLADKPLLEYQLNVFTRFNIKSVSLVAGYLSQQFAQYPITIYLNPLYRQSNMVYSLMAAAPLFDSDNDLIIAYGDIVYEDKVFEQMLNSKGDVVVSADSSWLDLWSMRMDNPLADAESFIYDKDSMSLRSLGKKISSYEQAQAQYIGLIKINANVLKTIKHIYQKIAPELAKNMYLTDFINILIDQSIDVRASIHKRGWLEVDTSEDLETYQAFIAQQACEKLGFIPPCMNK
jgi:choline kinase